MPQGFENVATGIDGEEMRTMRPDRRAFLAAGAATIVGCSGRGGPATKADPLRIAAASDLQSALPVLTARFRLDRGVEAVSTFGASGSLTQQIRQGAPFDVFLAANRAFVDGLSKDGLVLKESVRPYARGVLVLAMSRSMGDTVKVPTDIAGPRVKTIALANPKTAPYGQAAMQVLERSGLRAKVEEKLVYAESVRQAAQYVSSGNADVAFIGHATADTDRMTLRPIDLGLYDPLIQALGVVAASKRPEEARAFADFVVGPTGQGILRDFRFMSAGDEGAERVG